MGFEVRPARIAAGHPGPRAAIVALAGLAVVGSGLAASLLAPTEGGPMRLTHGSAAPGMAEQAASSIPRRAAISPAPAASVAPARVLRPYPGVVDCAGLGSVACAQLVMAAMREPDSLPAVSSAAASASIICEQPDDCPPARFVGYRPLGSVVLSFGPRGPAASYDVAEPVPFPGRVWDPTDLETWMVRWRAAG